MIVFFSTKSGNTKRFVERFKFDNIQIPLNASEEITVNKSYILILPTYGGGYAQGAVPKQVIKFLNNPDNRKHIKGVISTGNRNFGDAFCLAGRKVSEKCKVPNLASIELFGSMEDAEELTPIIEQLIKDV